MEEKKNLEFLRFFSPGVLIFFFFLRESSIIENMIGNIEVILMWELGD